MGDAAEEDDEDDEEGGEMSGDNNSAESSQDDDEEQQDEEGDMDVEAPPVFHDDGPRAYEGACSALFRHKASSVKDHPVHNITNVHIVQRCSSRLCCRW